MKNAIIAGLLMGAAHGMTVPVLADPIKEEHYFSAHARWGVCY